MAKKNKIVWKKEGLEELANAHSVRELENEIADDIIYYASEQGKVKGYTKKDRYLQEKRAAVGVSAEEGAANHNWKHHALLEAMEKAKRV